MLKFIPVLVFAFLFSQCSAQSDESFESNDEIVQRKATSYEILVLSQSWPQTSCWSLNRLWSEESTCSKCKMPKDKASWTAHGLWPSNKKGTHPSKCNNEKYNPKLLSSSLRTTLEEKWPTFNLKMSVDQFWQHEWTKHGTCAMQLESTNTLPKYFSKTVKLLDQYNVGTILADAGIVPGKKYQKDALFQVVEGILGVKTYFSCATNSATKEQYVQEFHVCFDKSFQPTDCGQENQSNCKSELVYPENLNTC